MIIKPFPCPPPEVPGPYQETTGIWHQIFLGQTGFNAYVRRKVMLGHVHQYIINLHQRVKRVPRSTQ